MENIFLPATWIAQLEPFLLGMPRIGTAMMTIGLLPHSVFPRQLRIAKTIVLSLAIYPLMLEHTSTGLQTSNSWAPIVWVPFILKEAFIGGLIGYLMGTILWAFASTGEIIDTQIGFQIGQIFDPMSDRPQGPIGSFYGQFGALLFVALGGIHVFLALLFESFALWPTTSFLPALPDEGLSLSIEAGATVLQLAAQLFLPLFGILLLLELGVGVLNRIAPQFEGFYFSLPIKAAVGILLIALLLSHMVDLYRGALHKTAQKVQQFNSQAGP